VSYTVFSYYPITNKTVLILTFYLVSSSLLNLVYRASASTITTARSSLLTPLVALILLYSSSTLLASRVNPLYI